MELELPGGQFRDLVLVGRAILRLLADHRLDLRRKHRRLLAGGMGQKHRPLDLREPTTDCGRGLFPGLLLRGMRRERCEIRHRL